MVSQIRIIQIQIIQIIQIQIIQIQIIQIQIIPIQVQIRIILSPDMVQLIRNGQPNQDYPNPNRDYPFSRHGSTN